MTANRWTAAAFGYAGLVFAPFAFILYGIPVQVTDSYGAIVGISGGTLWSVIGNSFFQHNYLRPLMAGQIRLVQDLAGGNLYEWYRGWHVAQVAVLFVLFVRLLRPATAAQAAAVPVGLAALIGMHTFAGVVREAFPVNHFLTIVLCCVAAADLALGEPRAWRSAAAVAVFVLAALTIETGLLVGVVIVAGYLAGARGVSRRGVGAVLVLFAGYFAVRYAVLHVGTPDLQERPSGFGFATYEPAELIRMFGEHPLAFYAYNVAASLASLLFAEPRGGVFALTRDLVRGTFHGGLVTGAVASTLATLLIVQYAWGRRAVWRSGERQRGDQLLAIFVAVSLANAAMCYVYTKDVIMSPAGVFLAVMLSVSLAAFIGRQGVAVRSGDAVARVGFASVLFVAALSSAWALRAIGIHVAMRESAVTMRNEWAYVDQFLEHDGTYPAEPRALALKTQLQEDAIWRHPPHGAFAEAWARWLEE